MSVIAAYSGTFDPVTYGHTDIIRRAAAMFPNLIVAVGLNPSKNPRFTLEERIALVEGVVEHFGLTNVTVQGFSVSGVQRNAGDGAHRLALRLVEMSDAFGAQAGIDLVDLLALVDRLIRTHRLTDIAVDAFVGNLQ